MSMGSDAPALPMRQGCSMSTNRTSVAQHENLIVGVSASPSEHSTTALVLDNLLARTASADTAVKHIRIRDLSPDALVRADASDPGLRHGREAADDDAIYATLGLQAEALNRLQHWKHFKTQVGHSLLEVVGGVVFGAVVTWVGIWLSTGGE